MKWLILILLSLILLFQPSYALGEEVSYKLADWEDAEELGVFLEEDNTDRTLYLRADKDGVIRFNNRCEVFAIQLMDRAAEKGKRLSFVPINSVEYNKWYPEKIESGRYHVVCGALVGDNEFWYIEPTDDRYWHALNLE